MIEYRLDVFVKEHSQRLASEVLGISAQAVHAALRNKRDIRIVSHGDHVYSGYEVKPISDARTITESSRAA